MFWSCNYLKIYLKKRYSYPIDHTLSKFQLILINKSTECQ